MVKIYITSYQKDVLTVDVILQLKMMAEMDFA